jgi:hypothetical protein
MGELTHTAWAKIAPLVAAYGRWARGLSTEMKPVWRLPVAALPLMESLQPYPATFRRSARRPSVAV